MTNKIATMKIKGIRLFPIGIGTWGIGGYAKKDPKNDDEKQIDALAYSFSRGMNLVEVNYWTAEGHSVGIVAEALKRSRIPREKVFLHQALYSYRNPTLENVREEMEKVRRMFNTDYMDSIEFSLTGFNQYGFKNVIDFLREALEAGTTGYVSATNLNLEYLKMFYEAFEGKVFAHELNFNFEIRENEDWYITRFAKEKGILNVLYQPLRRNRTAKRNWPLLNKLAEKYQKTQNQIIVNWLVSKGFLPLIKSENKKHIDENISALNFKIEAEDLELLNRFRPPNWQTPAIQWRGESSQAGKVAVHQLSNVFDELYDSKLLAGS